MQLYKILDSSRMESSAIFLHFEGNIGGHSVIYIQISLYGDRVLLNHNGGIMKHKYNKSLQANPTSKVNFKIGKSMSKILLIELLTLMKMFI